MGIVFWSMSWNDKGRIKHKGNDKLIKTNPQRRVAEDSNLQGEEHGWRGEGEWQSSGAQKELKGLRGEEPWIRIQKPVFRYTGIISKAPGFQPIMLYTCNHICKRNNPNELNMFRFISERGKTTFWKHLWGFGAVLLRPSIRVRVSSGNSYVGRVWGQRARWRRSLLLPVSTPGMRVVLNIRSHWAEHRGTLFASKYI